MGGDTWVEDTSEEISGWISVLVSVQKELELINSN